MSAFERFCEARKVHIDARYGAVEVPDGWLPGTHPYKVTLRYRGRRLTCPFFMGPAHEREPSAADVLSCLISDALSVESASDFEDWCSELGYDPDSRKALATYNACEASAVKLRKLLGDDYDAFAKVSHDH